MCNIRNINTRNYRQHLKDKKFIENRSTVSQEALDWARNYKITMLRKKLEKEKTMLEEHLMYLNSKINFISFYLIMILIFINKIGKREC